MAPAPLPDLPVFPERAARPGFAPAAAARHHVVTEVIKGVIDHRAHGFGGVALAPEWNAEPIADLGWFLAELGDPAGADHGRRHAWQSGTRSRRRLCSRRR